jgi:hypothetical protein
MKKLLLILLISFLSSSSLAKIGDMYVCDMGEHYSTEVFFNGVEKRELEQFTFKREKDSITIFSKEEGGFERGSFDIYEYFGSEDFEAENWKVLISYHNSFSEDDINEVGFFNYVNLHHARGMTTVAAICYILK